ncbi:MAG: glycosyltransferase family 4 protein [Nitrospinae bacterium]|nr:glycosyltransferase family 4 protein [Nitrospinota bacterium]
MNITFLLPHVKISGGVKALLEYANRLQKMGHRVRIFVPGDAPKWYRPDKKWKARKEGLKNLPPETVDWMDNALSVEVFPGSDPRHLPAADILLASAWQTAEFAAQLPPEKGKPFYLVQHYESLWTRDKVRAAKTYDLPLRQLTISTWLKDILSEKHGQAAEVLVTPVDRNIFFCDSKQWNSPPRVCMLHHDYDWKGYAEGIEVIRNARAQGRKLELVVFGEKLKNPQPLFESAGFNFEYVYRPTRERLREIYASCDIYLCPSWYEGLGMPAMEAMACRCALVTADTGGCLDYAIDGQTALVSPSRNIERLTHNRIRLLDDEGLLKTLSENGCLKICEFDWQDNCERLELLFKESLK